MRSAITFALALFVTPLLAQHGVAPDLRKLADTERAFAKRAQEVAVRDAFIEFFADESIGFEPDPTPARRNRGQPIVRRDRDAGRSSGSTDGWP